MNRECQQLHETIVRDIVDIISDFKDMDEYEWLTTRNSTGSIAKRASNLTLVFPVIVSSSVSISAAIMISKAIERKCVSLLQILFSSIQYDNSADLQDYIGRFHKNLRLNNRMDLDDFMDVMSKLDESGAIDVLDRDVYDAVMEDMKNINYVLSTDFNPVSINNYKQVKNVYGESAVVLEAIYSSDMDKFGADVYNGMVDAADAIRRGLENHRPANINVYGGGRGGGGPHDGNSLKDRSDYYSKQVLSTSEIRKANELMPTVMMVNFTSVKDGTPIQTTGVIGVKAKMYPVDAMEICTRLSSKNKERNGLFNLIRATTREISFFKDFAFAIEKAKTDAILMSKDSNNARMFRVLERRAQQNKFLKLIKRNDASPITSLVISQDDVEYMKTYYDLDMERTHTTRGILESYNLMDIVISDESMEIAKFMFDDGEGVYETLTFDALEKEGNDNSYKKVVNLMSKMNR